MLPDCNGTHLTLDSPYSNQGQLAGYIYLSIGCISMPICSFVFYVFSRPNVKQSSCYKLLMITTSLDILNLISATIVSGFASIFGVSYCDNGFKWLYPYGHFFMCVWYIYCASTEVLALNRMLVFARPQLAIFLFKGRRVWLWLIPIFVYSAFGLLIDPSMYFVYLPNRGFFLDGKTSVFHIFNNFFKLGFVTACYIIMTLFIIKLKRKNTNERGSRISSHQITLSLQTLGVAALADFTSCGYLGANYFPDHWAISQYSGNIGQLEWIFLHSKGDNA
ncbi:hypothetical protein L596_012904 [Steinernema carpocapsae]|uniref:G-protein coupled receptors family 1 profile domain-containing protein n=1 Tax=Steinernema carpocapsae TaxID=34508 RepID=A0A4U5NZ35_STECR|nr:hypothetical protein L596_012904 [Steinernema carpocapsae]